jgi:peptide/nickel transport system permease protein
MTKYLIRRALSTAVLIFLVSSIVFFMVHLLPGDPALTILGGEFTSPTEAQLETVRDELGLNEPLHRQYIDWLSGIVLLDLGTSLTTGDSVIDTLMTRFARSAFLAVPAMVLAVLVGMPLGMLAAQSRKTVWDPIFSAIALMGFSTPLFVSGLLLVYIFAINIGWLPSGGYTNPTHNLQEFLRLSILPIVTLSLPSIAVIMRMTRSSVLEQIGMDYVRTARSKGLAERNVLAVHVIRNALLPVITVMGLQFGNLVTGSVLVEFIFSWPGLGRLLLTSVASRDYPVIQAIILVVACAFVVLNFLTDMSYAVIDPRIRYK